MAHVPKDNATTSEDQEHVVEDGNHSYGSSVKSENLDLESAEVDIGENPEIENSTKETLTSTGDSLTIFTIESARNMFKKWKADRVPSHELVYNIDIPRDDPRIPSDGSTNRSRLAYLKHSVSLLSICNFFCVVMFSSASECSTLSCTGRLQRTDQ